MYRPPVRSFSFLNFSTCGSTVKFRRTFLPDDISLHPFIPLTFPTPSQAPCMYKLQNRNRFVVQQVTTLAYVNYFILRGSVCTAATRIWRRKSSTNTIKFRHRYSMTSERNENEWNPQVKSTECTDNTATYWHLLYACVKRTTRTLGSAQWMHGYS